MSATILIVEDEFPLRRLLRNVLIRANYEVVEAMNAREALRTAASRHPSAVLLDLGLPDRDGLELIAPLLQMGATVIVVSARDATDEKVAALDLGAHDYVTKPFDGDELLARLRVGLRQRASADGAPRVVRIGDLSIDLEERRVERGGAEVHLTRKEYDVLAALAHTPGRVVLHDRLMAAGWGGDDDARIEYLRVVVRNLRQKVEAPEPVGALIANELGVGYRLLTRAPTEATAG